MKRPRKISFTACVGLVLMTSPLLVFSTAECQEFVWIQRTPATSPSPRWQHGLAYDSAGGRVVLFEGFTGSPDLADTWEWDGTNWTERTPAASPTGRFGLCLVPPENSMRPCPAWRQCRSSAPSTRTDSFGPCQSQLWTDWRSGLILVKPETVLRYTRAA